MSMNRRTFIQSMAAAFAAVATGVRLTAAPRPIDYSLFTSNDGWYAHRFDLEEPFSVDGAIYATDARVIVTHPGEWSGNDTARIPNVGKLWWDEFDAPGWHPLRTVKVPRNNGAHCPVCRGEGIVSPTGVDCGRCLGTGEIVIDADCGVCDRCPDCINGKLGTKCPGGCDRGWVDWCERIDSGLFCPGYLSRVRTLGELSVRVMDAPARYGKGGILLFRGANNVRGMLMGISGT